MVFPKCRPACESLVAEDNGAQHGGPSDTEMRGHSRANRGQEGCDIGVLSRNAGQATLMNWSCCTPKFTHTVVVGSMGKR